jgi:hypothetical protein
MRKAAWAGLILGVIGVVLGGLVTLVSVLLPPLTHGRTSWGEAMLGIIPGAVVLLISILIAGVCLVVVILQKKKSKP